MPSRRPAGSVRGGPPSVGTLLGSNTDSALRVSHQRRPDMHRVSKQSFLLAVAVAFFFAAIGYVTLTGRSREIAHNPVSDHAVRRGAYLVKIMGCNDCHTPWKMGPEGPEP